MKKEKDNIASKVLTGIHVLNAIYKHRAISSNELWLLFGGKSKIAVQKHLQRLKDKKYIVMHRTPAGVWYSITSSGSTFLGVNRTRPVKSIKAIHSHYEILTIVDAVRKGQIKYESFDELLQSYQTDREIKREKFAELGGKALKLRWVDLIITTSTGDKIAYEVELNKKDKIRYKGIINKIDNQFSSDGWSKVIWVLPDKSVTWYKKLFLKYPPAATTAIIKISSVERKQNG